MPEPEILRRCAVCGAAFRPGAVFCPQCGNAASRPDSKVDGPESVIDPNAGVESLVPEKPKRNLPGPAVTPYVEKGRKVTSVFIDEATYDPSLRFVVVAAGLFVLFLVLLVLSKVMT